MRRAFNLVTNELTRRRNPQRPPAKDVMQQDQMICCQLRCAVKTIAALIAFCGSKHRRGRVCYGAIISRGIDPDPPPCAAPSRTHDEHNQCTTPQNPKGDGHSSHKSMPHHETPPDETRLRLKRASIRSSMACFGFTMVLHCFMKRWKPR